MRIIGVVAAKGGCSKTSTVINTAAALAESGHRVLVVDFDPQGDAGFVLLSGERPARPTMAEVLTGHADAADAIVSTNIAGVNLLPADATLADATIALAGEIGREARLREAMADVGGYDVVLLDTAPTRSLLTTNALAFVRELVVPMSPAVFGVLGLGQLQADVAQVRRYLGNPTLAIRGVLLTMVEKNNLCRDLESQLRDQLGALVFATKIPRSVKVESAHSAHQSVLAHSPGNPASEAYRAFARELIDGSGQANGVQRADRHPGQDDGPARAGRVGRRAGG